MKLHPLPRRVDEVAIDAAHRMRALLVGDMDEILKATTVKELNSSMDQDLLLSAWGYLSSSERTIWKKLCKAE